MSWGGTTWTCTETSSGREHPIPPQADEDPFGLAGAAALTSLLRGAGTGVSSTTGHLVRQTPLLKRHAAFELALVESHAAACFGAQPLEKYCALPELVRSRVLSFAPVQSTKWPFREILWRLTGSRARMRSSRKSKSRASVRKSRAVRPPRPPPPPPAAVPCNLACATAFLFRSSCGASRRAVQAQCAGDARAEGRVGGLPRCRLCPREQGEPVASPCIGAMSRSREQVEAGWC